MQKKPFIKRLRNNTLYGCVLLLRAFSLIVPRWLGHLIFGAFGYCIYLFPSRDRAAAFENLREFYGPDVGRHRIRQSVRNVYINFARNVFDVLYLGRCPDKKFSRIVFVDGAEELLRLNAQGQGIVGITGHLGAFELMLQAFSRRGVKCVTVGQKLYDPRIDRIVQKMRRGDLVEYMHRDGSARGILRNLRDGRLFGVLTDQDTKVEGVFADFLGKEAWTPSAPMRIAMSGKYPVVVAWTARYPDGTHHIVVHGPLELQDTGDFEADLVANVTMANKIFCEGIKAFPEQWVWMHRRWKTKRKNDTSVV